MTALGPHVFWVLSRAAGISAMVLSSIAVGFGLSMSGRLGRGRLADRRVVHEALSIGVMIALAVHAFALLGDRYLHPSLADVSVPFASDYRTGWTTAGIIAGWGLVLLGLSFYARRRIGINRWKIVHRFTALAWLAGLVHAVGEGTDAGEPWFLALLGLTAVPPLALLAIRVTDRVAPTPRTSTPLSTTP